MENLREFRISLDVRAVAAIVSALVILRGIFYTRYRCEDNCETIVRRGYRADQVADAGKAGADSADGTLCEF
jgi:hypothetical protein